MDLKTQMRQGLQAPRALEELLRVVHGFYLQGMSQELAYAHLLEFLKEVRFTCGETEVLVVLQILDMVSGHVSEDLRLWDELIEPRHGLTTQVQV